MTTYKTAPVDPTQPMELDDGTPVELIKTTASDITVRIAAGIHYRRDGVGSAYSRVWKYSRTTGVSVSGAAAHYKVLRNVAAANPYSLFVGKKLQTRSGTPAEFITVHNGRAIFKLTYPNAGWGAQTTGFVERNLDGTVPGLAASTPYGSPGIVRQDADDIIVVPERVTTYRNIYADGTIGETVHKTATAVVNGIKSGKVRVGYLMQVHEGAELVKAEVITTTPARRDGSKAFPKA